MSDTERRIAIVDLGTNTFNLLIIGLAEDGSWRELFRNSIPVKLAQGGITRQTIAQERFFRGVDTMMVHKAAIANYRCAETHAYATSAVREAMNGVEFTQLIREKTGIAVKIIDGSVEAELIHEGVAQTLPESNDPYLIMDIGGGSTEFMISAKGKVLWKQSFPLGVSRILEVLQPKDPIPSDTRKEFEGTLRESLKPLWEAASHHRPKHLVGASGSFKTFIQILERRGGVERSESTPQAAELDRHLFQELSTELIRKDFKERLRIKGMHPMRAETLHLSAIMTQLVLKELGLERLYQSSYALKEGVAYRIAKERME